MLFLIFLCPPFKDKRRISFPAGADPTVPSPGRVDVDFDLPEAFIPEFLAAIYLSNRPELGEVSRCEVVAPNTAAGLRNSQTVS
jgi:hypothetical protein